MEDWKKSVEERLESLDKRLESLDKSLDNIGNNVTWLRDNTVQILDFLEAQYSVDLRTPTAPPTTPVLMTVSPEPQGGDDRCGGRGDGLDEERDCPYWLHSHDTGELESGISEVKNEKDKFMVNLDVTHFSSEEIQVKTKENNLIVTGTHEEKIDQHGFVSRLFSRRYILPKEVDVGHIVSNLSRDGVLTIEAKKKVVAGDPNERIIPIQTTT